MSEAVPMTDNEHYERACSRAIAMCDGNLRSTIKALIMANEFLEAELTELQAAISSGCAPVQSQPIQSAAGRSRAQRSKGLTEQSDVRHHLLCRIAFPAG